MTSIPPKYVKHEIPTTWCDLDGKIQTTYGLTNVMFYNGYSVTNLPGLGSIDPWESGNNKYILLEYQGHLGIYNNVVLDNAVFRSSKHDIETNGTCTYYINGTPITFIVLRGELISLGSSVKCLGPLVSDQAGVPLSFNMFENAKSLTTLVYTFSDYGKHQLIISPDLFRGAPNLETLFYTFHFSEITNIPGDLFSTNVNLHNIEGCFDFCQKLHCVGPNLFFNQKKLTNIKRVFNQCPTLSYIYPTLFDLDSIRNNFNSEDEYEAAFDGAFSGLPLKVFGQKKSSRCRELLECILAVF